jgi:hypothetical protein
MRAEDLHIASVITWWNRQNVWKTKTGANRQPTGPLVRFDQNRYYHAYGGEDERGGGAILFVNLPRPLEIAEAASEFPSSASFVSEARTFAGAWVDMEKPYGWDVPLWLAKGQVDSAGLANANMCRDGMYRGGEEPGNCKPRDAARLPPPLGNGFWTLETYYHMLNCGFRIPPSAGSASGGMPNNVGYNRVYVYVEGELTYEKWWDAFRTGRCFVTNGPLLRCAAEGKRPGHVFRAAEGDEVSLELTAQLSSTDPIRTIEIVKNGQLERAVTLTRSTWNGSLGRMTFQESGWFAIRVIAEHAKTFRFAHTGPFYIEIGKTPQRLSITSSAFFRDWTLERSQQLRGAVSNWPELRAQWDEALKFWENRVEQANAP